MKMMLRDVIGHDHQSQHCPDHRCLCLVLSGRITTRDGLSYHTDRYRPTTKTCATQNLLTLRSTAQCPLWPAYVLRSGSLLARLVFSNENASVLAASRPTCCEVELLQVPFMSCILRWRSPFNNKRNSGDREADLWLLLHPIFARTR